MLFQSVLDIARTQDRNVRGRSFHRSKRRVSLVSSNVRSTMKMTMSSEAFPWSSTRLFFARKHNFQTFLPNLSGCATTIFFIKNIIKTFSCAVVCRMPNLFHFRSLLCFALINNKGHHHPPPLCEAFALLLLVTPPCR